MQRITELQNQQVASGIWFMFYNAFMLRSQFVWNSSDEFAVCDVWNFTAKKREKLPVTWNHMSIYVEIERASDTTHRQLPTMPKGKRLCSIARVIINSVFDCFAWLEKHGGGCSPVWFLCSALYNRIKAFANNILCVGIFESAITRLGKGSSAGSSGVSSPAKRCKQLRGCILVDTFEKEEIRHIIYQLYDQQEHDPLKLLPKSRLFKNPQNMQKLSTRLGSNLSLQIGVFIVDFLCQQNMIE